MQLIPLVPRLGAALLLCGFALVLWPSLFIFVTVSAVGFAIGLAVLYTVLDKREALRVCWIVATALLFGYDGGSLATYLNADSSRDFAIMVKDRPIELISLTLALVNITSGLVLIAGHFERSVAPAVVETTRDSWFSFIVVCFGLALIAAAYVAGDLGYMGIQTDTAGRISVLGAAAGLAEGPLAGIAGYMAARGRNKTVALAYVLIVALVALAAVPIGRRPIVLIMLVAALGFALGGGLKKLSLAQKIAGIVGGGAFAYVASSYFFALRLANWELGNDASFGSQLWLGLEFMLSPTLQERFSALFYDNVRERTFMLGYLADLAEAVGRSGPLYGEALVYYVRLAIPSVLDPAKDQILAYQMVEALVHPKLGLPVIDQANTLLTDGITDFGIFGAVIYPFAAVGLLRAMLWAIQKVTSPITLMFGTFAVLHLAFKPEVTLDEYFVLLRNLAIFIPVMWLAETLMSPVSGKPSDSNLTMIARR